ncbi:MAG: phosphate ABC transporter permease PstA [Proteobacteria bacterium]|nr:phosphate ABC transporter permease PstA [Pseudomonadota bacterium]
MLIASAKVAKQIAARHRKERRFRFFGLAAVGFTFLFLSFLLINIFMSGIGAFTYTTITLPVTFKAETIDPTGARTEDVLRGADYNALIQDALLARFPEAATDRAQTFKLFGLISKNASDALRDRVLKDPNLIGTTVEVPLLASSSLDLLRKGTIDRSAPENLRTLSDNEIHWFDTLKNEGRVHVRFNHIFFDSSDSREPEQAGILGAALGSLFVIVSCMLLAFPLGVLTAVYLEEFAPRNTLTDIVEVNINNLAAVPSIVYGLLGLWLYLNMLGLPRSSSLAGGLTLALMVLPIIIITTRTSLKSVPPSIRDAASALGASPLQVVIHHTLPLALPGIMTGTILSIARALGETAPLILIGMVAFVADVPTSFLSPATAMPVQIYLWSDSPEMGFRERTSAAILILLVVLIVANACAAWVRKKFERKW